MIRVILIDDHPMLRMGVSQFLAASGAVKVVGEAGDGIPGLKLAETVEWDVAVLDISMANLGGFELAKRLLARDPSARIVVLSHHPAAPFATRALREGARAFVSKSAPPEQLLEAITTVAAGRVWSAASEDDVREPQAPSDAQPHELLTRREYQVFVLIAQGRSTIDVAAELDVSASTVSNHIANIKEKLGVTTRGEIVAYAMRAKLIE